MAYRLEMTFEEFYVRQLVHPDIVRGFREWLGDRVNNKYTYNEWMDLLKEFENR